MIEFSIRKIADWDASDMAALFGSIGFDTPIETFPQRLARSRSFGDAALVAEENGQVIGCVGLSIMHPPHRDKPVGRITVLVVAEGRRGCGIGSALVERATQHLADAGCTIVEVTSRFELERAHAFYERIGFKKTSVRLALEL